MRLNKSSREKIASLLLIGADNTESIAGAYSPHDQEYRADAKEMRALAEKLCPGVAQMTAEECE